MVTYGLNPVGQIDTTPPTQLNITQSSVSRTALNGVDCMKQRM